MQSGTTDTKTAHDRAYWLHWSARERWQLLARKKDGGEVLATIERRCGEYLWALGTADLENAHRSLYAAQRAVRKALREQK